MKNMSEKRLVIDGLELNYSGMFELEELLRKIDSLTAERGYVKNEKKRTEITRSYGKEFNIELRPTKKKTDYFTLMIKMRISITNLREVIVEKQGAKTKLNKGNVKIIFDAWTTSYYEGIWEQKPLFYYLRHLFEKAIYQFHTDEHIKELSDDCHYIYNNVKSFLELYEL